MKKNIVENIMPIIIALKHNFEKCHSPLQRPLLLYLREILRDYKDEANGTISFLLLMLALRDGA
jgi:condensin-2 complex subunit D3